MVLSGVELVPAVVNYSGKCMIDYTSHSTTKHVCVYTPNTRLKHLNIYSTYNFILQHITDYYESFYICTTFSLQHPVADVSQITISINLWFVYNKQRNYFALAAITAVCKQIKKITKMHSTSNQSEKCSSNEYV